VKRIKGNTDMLMLACAANCYVLAREAYAEGAHPDTIARLLDSARWYDAKAQGRL
jgi:hypothetical protein